MKTATVEYWNNLRAKSVKKYQEKGRNLKPLNSWQLKRYSPIRKASLKQAKKLREYDKNKAAYLETIEHCEFPGCEIKNVTLHHMAGRIGDNLTDTSKFKALCWVHHQWCEENPNEAKELGLSLSRLDKHL